MYGRLKKNATIFYTNSSAARNRAVLVHLDQYSVGCLIIQIDYRTPQNDFFDYQM